MYSYDAVSFEFGDKLNHQIAGLFNAGTQAHDPWTVVILASFKDWPIQPIGMLSGNGAGTTCSATGKNPTFP